MNPFWRNDSIHTTARVVECNCSSDDDNTFSNSLIEQILDSNKEVAFVEIMCKKRSKRESRQEYLMTNGTMTEHVVIAENSKVVLSKKEEHRIKSTVKGLIHKDYCQAVVNLVKVSDGQWEEVGKGLLLFVKTKTNEYSLILAHLEPDKNPWQMLVGDSLYTRPTQMRHFICIADDGKDIMGIVFTNDDEAANWKHKFDKKQEERKPKENMFNRKKLKEAKKPALKPIPPVAAEKEVFCGFTKEDPNRQSKELKSNNAFKKIKQKDQMNSRIYHDDYSAAWGDDKVIDPYLDHERQGNAILQPIPKVVPEIYYYQQMREQQEDVFVPPPVGARTSSVFHVEEHVPPPPVRRKSHREQQPEPSVHQKGPPADPPPPLPSAGARPTPNPTKGANNRPPDNPPPVLLPAHAQASTPNFVQELEKKLNHSHQTAAPPVPDPHQKPKTLPSQTEAIQSPHPPPTPRKESLRTEAEITPPRSRNASPVKPLPPLPIKTETTKSALLPPAPGFLPFVLSPPDAQAPDTVKHGLPSAEIAKPSPPPAQAKPHLPAASTAKPVLLPKEMVVQSTPPPPPPPMPEGGIFGSTASRENSRAALATVATDNVDAPVQKIAVINNNSAPPAPPPPPSTLSGGAPKDIPKEVTSDVRNDLMSAIRNAGGINTLKSAKKQPASSPAAFSPTESSKSFAATPSPTQAVDVVASLKTKMESMRKFIEDSDKSENEEWD